MEVKTPLWHASLEPYDPCPVTDAPRGTGRPRSLSLQLCSASELITDQLQTRANHYLQIHHILRKNHCTPITCFSLSLSLSSARVFFLAPSYTRNQQLPRGFPHMSHLPVPPPSAPLSFAALGAVSHGLARTLQLIAAADHIEGAPRALSGDRVGWNDPVPFRSGCTGRRGQVPPDVWHHGREGPREFATPSQAFESNGENPVPSGEE